MPYSVTAWKLDMYAPVLIRVNSDLAAGTS
jgi:hypothetical protein